MRKFLFGLAFASGLIAVLTACDRNTHYNFKGVLNGERIEARSLGSAIDGVYLEVVRTNGTKVTYDGRRTLNDRWSLERVTIIDDKSTNVLLYGDKSSDEARTVATRQFTQYLLQALASKKTNALEKIEY